MDKDLLKSIDLKLGLIVKMLGIRLAKNLSKEEQADVLTNVGMNATEVAKILGKSPSTIRNQRLQKKRKIKQKKNNDE